MPSAELKEQKHKAKRFTCLQVSSLPPYIIYMVGFQNDRNVFPQNGALIAIPWEPASKSPLSSNHTQTTGMLNMKACQLQKL